jgi:hypothetical protein
LVGEESGGSGLMVVWDALMIVIVVVMMEKECSDGGIVGVLYIWMLVVSKKTCQCQ